jgi:hypothetical protein
MGTSKVAILPPRSVTWSCTDPNPPGGTVKEPVMVFSNRVVPEVDKNLRTLEVPDLFQPQGHHHLFDKEAR